jgi:xanthine dehydrogenase YagR molybdenum-binding subunit
MSDLIGAPVDRVDGQAKVTGTATYAAEVQVANVAHAVIVGSAVATGRLARLDIRAASKAPGVLKILTPDTAPRLPPVARDPKNPGDKVLQLLQDDKIWYADQPIAVVVADTLERAQHAAKLLEPRYDTGKAAFADIAASLGEAFEPKPFGVYGEADSARGNVVAGLAAAAHSMQETYTTPPITHNPMEPHATTCVWQGDKRLTVYDSTQGIFNVRNTVAKALGLDAQNVRVIDHFVGGGFGCKGSPWSHVVLCAMAARAVGRPVKLVLTRQQMFGFVGHRPQTIQTVAVGVDVRGKLTALRHDTISETSRFDVFAEPSSEQSRYLYACPNVATTHRLVRIDIGTPTFTRAPGKASGTFALECAMDELAYKANLDPLELRLRNVSERDDHENKPYSSKQLVACYKQAAERFGWAKRPPKPGTLRDGDWLVGMGMATAVYPAKQSPSSARATLKRDGTLLVQAGTQDIGTGTYTIMTQIAAETLGLPIERVRFELGDTALPEAPLSAGSRTAASAGSAVRRACLALRDKLKLPHADGDVSVEIHHDPGMEREKYSSHAHGAQFAEVRVDADTGELRVARVVGAFACGRVLNPKTAASQLKGGIVWGIGFALHEHTVRDRRTARVVTRDLADYHVPVHADIPDIDVILVDEPDPHVNELGIKGMGEIGITGIAAAIANAVFHATGKRIRDLPITLDKLV